MSNSNFTEIIVKKLKTELNEEVFSTWIAPNFIEVVDKENKQITITSTNGLISEYLKNIFDKKIKEIVKNSTSLDFEIFYNYLDENTVKEDTRKVENIKKQKILFLIIF